MSGASGGSTNGGGNTVTKTISKIADFSIIGRTVKGIYNSVQDNKNRRATDKNTANSRLSGSFTTEYNTSKGRTNNNSFTNNDSGDSGNDTAPTQVATNVGGKIIKSPTTAEVSQSSATDAAAYDNRKTKSKGRSMTIMTSSKGINRNNTLTLGKPSLLGR